MQCMVEKTSAPEETKGVTQQCTGIDDQRKSLKVTFCSANSVLVTDSLSNSTAYSHFPLCIFYIRINPTRPLTSTEIECIWLRTEKAKSDCK